MLDPTRGLLLLALANLVAFAAWSWITSEVYSAHLGLPYWLHSLQNAVRQSQWQSYGIAAALVPERRFVGLAWALGLALANGLIQVASLNAVSISRGGEALPFDQLLLRMAVAAYETIGVFALLQSMRFALGWRLAPDGQPRPIQRGQFRIGDLLEWTASIAVWLGINQFIMKIEITALFHYVLSVLGTAVILIPIGLATTSHRGLCRRTVFVLIIWIAAVELFFHALSYALDPRAFLWPWSLLLAVEIGSISGCVLCTAINFAIIRRIGFRWAGAQRQCANDEPVED